MLPDCQLRQWPPPGGGEIGVGGGGLYGSPQARRYAKDRLLSVVDIGGRGSESELPVPIQRQETRALPAIDGLDGLQTAVFQQDLGAGLNTLPHGGATRDDNQIGFLQPGGPLVEIRETRRQPRNLLIAVVEPIDPIDGGDHERFDCFETAAARQLLGDLEHPTLRLVEDLIVFAVPRTVGKIGDPGAGVNELPQHGVEPHDLGVGHYVGGARGVFGQGAEVGEATRIREFPAALQGLRQGYHIAGLVTLDQLLDCLEDQAVLTPIKIARRYLICDVVPGSVVEH